MVNGIEGLEANGVLARRRYFPAINWGAIVAGIVVGMATQIVLALLGVAAGLSAIARITSSTGSNVAVWVAVWQALSMLVAAFVGGYVAARMSGLQRNGDGMLQGLVTWGATTLIVASLAGSALGALFIAGFPGVSWSQPQAASGAEDWSPQPAVAIPLRAVQSARTDVVPTQATPDIRPPAADRPASAPSWWAFGAAALSMALAMAGGFAGVAGARRTRPGRHARTLWDPPRD